VPVNLIDLFPTYMSMTGIKDYPGLQLDGGDLMPVLRGEAKAVRTASGAVRDTMYWHFPIGLPQSSVIRKGGWKLRLNNASEANREPPVELFKLYHDNGSVNDLGESENLAETHPEKREELLQELRRWLNEFDAPTTYKVTSNNGGKLPGAEHVPKVLGRESRGGQVLVHLEGGGGKSRVIEAQLLYTANGSDLLRDGRGFEEWCSIRAKIEGNTVVANAPPGMTHGVFYLRDEQGFLITSEPVPPMSAEGAGIGSPGSSFIQDGYAYRPGLLALIVMAESAHRSAVASGQDSAALNTAIAAARSVAAQPVEEKPYALAMRQLRGEIRKLKVPEAARPILNQFKSERW